MGGFWHFTVPDGNITYRRKAGPGAKEVVASCRDEVVTVRSSKAPWGALENFAAMELTARLRARDKAEEAARRAGEIKDQGQYGAWPFDDKVPA